MQLAVLMKLITTGILGTNLTLVTFQRINILLFIMVKT